MFFLWWRRGGRFTENGIEHLLDKHSPSSITLTSTCVRKCLCSSVLIQTDLDDWKQFRDQVSGLGSAEANKAGGDEGRCCSFRELLILPEGSTHSLGGSSDR